MRETLISVAGIIFTALAAVGLALAAGSVAAAVTYTWTHNGEATDGTDIVNTDIAFQLEYSVEGGPLNYIDISPGEMSMAGGSVAYTDSLVVMCSQTLVARVRALWGGTFSAWSAQASAVADDCPAPSAPENFTMVIP